MKQDNLKLSRAVLLSPRATTITLDTNNTWRALRGRTRSATKETRR